MGWEEGDIKNHKGMYRCKVWKRDPLGVLQEILENGTIKDKVVWAPSKAYDHVRERVYTDLYTSDW